MSIPYPWERKNDVAPFFDASGRFFYEVWKGVPIKKVRCQSLAVITQGDLVISKETQIKAARRYGAYQILVRKGHQVVLEDYDKVVIQNILKWIDILPFPE